MVDKPNVTDKDADVETMDTDAGVETDASDKSAAADKSAATDTAAVLTWEWPDERVLTMYPCWAVRRVDEKSASADGRICNMEWEDKVFTDVSVGMVVGESLSDSFEVTIPMLVNKKHVGIDQELLLMAADRKAPRSE